MFCHALFPMWCESHGSCTLVQERRENKANDYMLWFELERLSFLS